MAFKTKDVMKSASTTLQDSGAIRWTAPELLMYLNDGVRSIVAIKPNAASKFVTLSMAVGCEQTLPQAYTVLSRITRNLTLGHDDVGGPAGGGTIRVLERREIMDSMIPGWMDPTVLPFKLKVEQVIYDLAAPRTFLVVPGM